MKIIYLLSIFLIGTLFASCNKELVKEQYTHYISFKAPRNDNTGVTPIHIPYVKEGAFTYKLPIMVSGSTVNKKNLKIQVAVDPDTLRKLNYERFQNRTDLYYKELSSKYFALSDTLIDIPSGKSIVLMDVDFTLEDIDLVDKWVLPLTIVDGPNYRPNPRRDYKKALLRIIPFNDFSGDYSATSYKVYLRGEEDGPAIVNNYSTAYVVDNETVFFYAGTMDEGYRDRDKYKIYAHFDRTRKEVDLYTDNPMMHLVVNETPTFSVEEVEDDTRPYIIHRYVTISNIDYNFTDYTSAQGSTIDYTVRGNLTLQRDINTQIPDRDQAIEW